MSTQPQFTAEIDQNEYLPAGRRTVDAIVTVTASGAGLRDGGTPPAAAQVIMVDTSGSMGMPATKLSEAKKATAVAIDTLRDGVPFAVISGTAAATLIYPAKPGMVPASEQSRREAKAAVARVPPPTVASSLI